MGRRLRDYQAQAIADTEARHAAGDLALAGVAATGLGKSTILGQTVVNHLERTGGHALVLAHRTELCDQLTETLAELAPGLPVQRVQGDRGRRPRGDVAVTVATTNTLGQWSKKLESLPRLDALLDVVHPTMVGYDEVHHAGAPTNRRLLDALRASGPNAEIPMLGVTATLTRADRYGLGDLLLDPPAFSYDTVFGIGRGYLVKPHGKMVVADHLDLKTAKVTAGDYQDGQLGEMIAQDAEQIVQAWLDHGQNRITAGFFPTVESAREILDAFRARGISAEIVTGDTPTGDGMFQRGSATRGTGIYGRLARGETRVLVGVMVTTEGWDCPPVSCILMGRPTRLSHLYQQIVGRGLRKVPAELVAALGWEPKEDCLILDVVGASRGQKLVSLVELVPTADVDTSALDSVPCDDCGKVRCACDVGAAERDPDGGRRKLKGPAFYEDFDLLISESDRWLATERGHPVLVAQGLRRFAVVLQEANGLYRVGHVAKRGKPDPQRIASGLTLDQARRAAEEWAIGLAPHLGHANAVWRTRSNYPPPGKLLGQAHRLGIADPGSYTAAELADAVAIREASLRMDILDQAGAAARRSA
jgi:superfamily II DNA or RNA helicase